MKLDLGLSLTSLPVLSSKGAGGLVPPSGYVFLIDADGFYLTDADGYYLVEAA